MWCSYHCYETWNRQQTWHTHIRASPLGRCCLWLDDSKIQYVPHLKNNNLVLYFQAVLMGCWYIGSETDERLRIKYIFLYTQVWVANSTVPPHCLPLRWHRAPPLRSHNLHYYTCFCLASIKAWYSQSYNEGLSSYKKIRTLAGNRITRFSVWLITGHPSFKAHLILFILHIIFS